jgi:RimJ/RimL family protein N-acetyltransferase
MPRLHGKKVMLREYRKEDLEHIRKWVTEAETTRNLSDSFLFPHSVTQSEDFLNMMMSGKGEMKGFVIADAKSEAYIGQLDLIKIDWKNRCARLGIVIGDKSNRGKGYGTEAIKLLQKFVFEEMNLNRLDLEVRGFNNAGQGCYTKCGFVEEGRLRQNLFVNGRYVDTIVMSILKSEWDKSVK